MSSFPGLIEEIKSLSVDEFTGNNESSTIYFLSHCHSDHMNGLSTLLNNSINLKRDVFLYGSPVTIQILKKQYRYTNRLRELNIGVEHCLNVPETQEDICVTLIPAGHCPGSVMFLFETDKRILYTGDIRLTANDLKKCNALYDTLGNQKKIDKIYLDTTFLDKSYFTFPTREESINAFLKLLMPRLNDTKNHLNIISPAHYGYEYLYIETAKRFKMPIHVSPIRYDLYKYIPEMDNAITLNSERTRIHSSCHSVRTTLKNICPTLSDVHPKHQIKIKTSIMRWKDKDFKSGIIEEDGENTYFLAYSSHCSYTELVDILHFLKPLEIHSCVKPKTKEQEVEMMKLIDEILKEIHETNHVNPVEERTKINWLLPDRTVSCEKIVDVFTLLEPVNKKQKIK